MSRTARSLKDAAREYAATNGMPYRRALAVLRNPDERLPEVDAQRRAWHSAGFLHSIGH